MIYDCGNLSELTISKTSNGLDSVSIDFGNGLGYQEVWINKSHGPLSIHCTGSIDIMPTSFGEGFKFMLSNMDSGTLFTENLLMGLAGIVCGSLLAYVFVKFAV